MLAAAIIHICSREYVYYDRAMAEAI